MRPETKVGLLFAVTLLLLSLFAWFLGVSNPFSSSKRLQVAYNFAGGIETGSPVRVMGIRVGKVENIHFEPKNKMPNGEEVKLIVDISVNDKAWDTLRADSRFFINLAGVIGEKYIEVSPGTLTEPALKSGQLVRGEDPPRIDQLISQSYGLAGQIMELVEGNKGSVVETIQLINNLVKNTNALLKQIDQTSSNQDVKKIITNMGIVTEDMAYFTRKLRSKDGEETLVLIKELIWRLKDLDKKAIKEFLQEEGIRARMF